MAGRNIVITGANRGIGLELVKFYCMQQDNVYAICRQRSDALSAQQAIIIDDVELSDPNFCQHVQAGMRGLPVDVLINNAGVWGNQSLGHIDYDEMQRLFAINTLAPIRLAEALLPQMGSGSKIAMITSRMGSVADNSSGGGYDYRLSKAALNMAGKTLSVDLAEEGISVAVLHPGFVQTDMVGGNGDISADIAAARLAACIDDMQLSNSGSFWHSNGELLPW